MNLQLKTTVKGNYRDIIRRFDRRLFEALAPRQAKMEIVTFTGSEKGDKVHIKFTSPVRAEWISTITENEINDQEAFFTDEGTQLPFPISYWKHKHIVRKISEDTSVIIDDITFKAQNPVLTILMCPAIFMGFYPRKKIYKKYFSNSGN